MSRHFDAIIKLAACLLLAMVLPPSAAALDSYKLLGRASIDAATPRLDARQRQWLDSRPELLLGTSAPDYPPFDITLSGEDYEGITADYAGLLSQALHLPVRVIRFDSRNAAIEALKQGRIDLLGSANRFEAVDSGISLSRPYAPDQPVLVTHSGDTRMPDETLAGMRLSMAYHYLPPEQVRSQYPGAELHTYPSFQSAINAVAFGQADVFLGDAISTRYLINNGYLNNIRIASLGRHEADGFGFAVRSDAPRLLEIVNRVLQDIPAETRNEIARRWSAGSDPGLGDRQLQFTAREQAWITAHRQVRVVVDEHDAPLSFFDSAGNLRGVTADLLDMIRLRTGLQFIIQRSSSREDMLRRVEQGQADLIGAVLPSQTLAERLAFSRPYLENSFVLVTRQGDRQPRLPQQLDGRQVAVARSGMLRTWLSRQHPRIVQVPFDSATQALQALLREQVDAAVLPLLSANYLLSSPEFEQHLHITATAGEAPALITLASRRDTPELASILDKALLAIAPQELAAVHDRWRTWTNSSASGHDYRPWVYRVLAGAGLLLLVLLAWNAWMRRQIHQRKLAERALSDQLEFMSALVNGTPHPIYVRDREGRLRLCNDSYLETFGARRDQVIGHTVTDGVLSDPSEARAYAQDYRRVMASGTPLVLDRPLHIGGRCLTIYHWILPFRDSLGEVQGIIGGWIDISERRRLIEDLQAAKDRADNASRAKSTFLATMSHEIRTPMNAVIGMLELALRRAEQGQLDRPALEVAYSSARGMLELIGDILDIARIEAGHLTLTPERASLRQLVESVVRMFDGLARQKHLELRLDFDAQLDTDVHIDPLRFKQILSNLIGNAIKFTPAGQVRVGASLAPGDSPCLHLTVQDTGIGISAADRARLFEPFAQADNTGQMARSGAGLGLVICRSLCQMMGGTLTLDSEPGQGTCVTLTLPLALLHAESAPSPAALPAMPSVRVLSILVVDDHPANRLLLSQQLSYLGHRCATAEQGEQGLEFWQQGRFDLLMVDCNMPVMNGYELTRAIRVREQAEQREPCIIWGFTANAQPEEMQRCRAAGMDDCLFKPISLGTLNARLAELGSATEAPAALFDAASLEQLSAGRPELNRRLLEQLLNSNREDHQALARLDAHRHKAALRDKAHHIKGAARIVSAAALVQACEALELACDQDAPDAEVQRCQQQLLDALAALEQALADTLQRTQ